ncbi:DNA-processing protein DprA [Paenibacillus thermotolerans]|uniref:DNA-processing protein DprA n=1 Tax=Paenibacillus thermotolerans TaxID=3027807 RepID=UPI002367CB82|nr:MULTISPECIES: DNA-processing protein DprA [unclassified Paenibacillus]
MEIGERSILIALHDIKGVGWETVNKIFTASKGDVTKLLEHPERLLKQAEVPPRLQREIVPVLTKSMIAGKLSFYESCNVQFVTWFDSFYPPLLRYIHKPPWVMYARGDLSLLTLPMISIVGTRHPTPYGREVSEWFGSEIAAAGFAVVSGLARGVDSGAHSGALRANGPTIAVLGCGLNVNYPPEHYELQRRIEEKGLVLSEYRWNTSPTKGSFPWRNRIIAGMSRGTVVVEAAERSGSLITTEFALETGRDIFAVPGLITSPKSAGTYRLLRDGAKMATRPSDVLEEYYVTRREIPANEAEAHTEEEAELLLAMGAEAVTVDDLLQRTGHTFGHLHVILLSLLMKKRIRALPGSAYIARLN